MVDNYSPGGIANILKGNTVAGKEIPKRKREKKSAKITADEEKLNKLFSRKNVAAEEFDASEQPEEKTALEPAPAQTLRIASKDHKKVIKQKLSARNEQASRTVFVGNLPVTVDKKELIHLFKKYGKIETVRFRSAMKSELKIPARVTVIKKDFHPLCKNLNAYVVFADKESALKALKRNNKEVEGAHIRVDLASTDNAEVHKKNSVFVGNMPFNAYEEDLRKHFEKCGPIENTRLVRDQATRVGKGFGFVQFKSQDSVGLAMELNGRNFMNRPLRIERCSKQENVKKRHREPKKEIKSEKDGKKSWQGPSVYSDEGKIERLAKLAVVKKKLLGEKKKKKPLGEKKKKKPQKKSRRKTKK